MNLKDAGLDLGLLIAGFAGAILTSSKQAGVNLGKTVASLIGGAASANYITPLILKVAHLEGDVHYGYGAGFLLGFCGLRGVEMLAEKFITTNDIKPNSPAKRTRK
ncbi:hypothetical protein UFOVP742_51 [uncultured Caudovirales phage]|uniref:Uncharacterized protein n=1 Tax=uncultured Caudovirales phage TaxID=2100421 RepID=A0A6J7X889_9CAUD|nr:hypothetical protein UFOVP742_51 [uncultured Caudovirales phage]